MNTQQNPTPTDDLTDTEAERILEQLEAEGHDTTPTGDEDSPQEPQNSPQEAQDGQEPTEGQEEPQGRSKASKDAAKYRARLRDTEAERDQLTEQVDTLRRQLIDQHIERAGMNPALLWKVGLEASEVLGDDGTVDPARVAEAVQAARRDYSIPDTRHPDPAQQASVDASDDQQAQLFRSS